MYIKLYKANSSCYIDKNFGTLEQVQSYLNISECPNFKTNRDGELEATVNDWSVTIKEGQMLDEGEGYVDMSRESGALDNII